MADLHACPTGDDLRKLLTGTYAGPDPDATREHVVGCPDCTYRAESLLKTDPLLADLRAAHRVGASGPAKTLVAELLRRGKRGPAAPGPDTSFLGPPAPDTPTDLGSLDRYRVVQLLGHGGMGMVFRAIDPTLRRTVALKVILPKYAGNAGLRQRFLEEARATAAVRSPHVAEVYDCGVWQGVPFLTMELLAGQTLDKRPRPMPAEAVRRIAFGIAKGLSDAHRAGMIHRDLKPGNIHLGTDARTGKPTVKLIDFGLARPVERTTEVTKAGELLGTPAYMSPEQARGKPVDNRTDLYSLGVILFQLTTGNLPYEGASEGVMAILTELATPDPLPAVRTVVPDLPAYLADLIDRLLAKKAADRPASADEVLAVLKAGPASAAEGSAAATPAVSTPYLAVPDASLPFAPESVTESVPPAAGTTTAAYVPAPASVPAGTTTAPYVPAAPETVPAAPTAQEETLPFQDIAAAPTAVPATTVPPTVAVPPPRPRPVWLLPAACVGLVVGGLLLGFALGAFKAGPAPTPAPAPAVEFVLVLQFPPTNLEVLIDGEAAKVEADADPGRARVRVARRSFALKVRRAGVVVADERVEIPADRRGAVAWVHKPVERPAPPPPVVEPDPRPAPGPSRPFPNPRPPIGRTPPPPVPPFVPPSRSHAVVGGTWERTTDELFLAKTGLDKTSTLLMGEPEWTDYDFALEFFRTGRAKTELGLCFRTSDAERYVLNLASADNKGVMLVHWNGTARSEVANAGFVVKPNAWYAVVVRVRGPRVEFLIAEAGRVPQPLLTATGLAVARGNVGLLAFESGYRFRDIKVTTPTGQALWTGLPDVSRVARLPAHLDWTPFVPPAGHKAILDDNLATDWMTEPADSGPWVMVNNAAVSATAADFRKRTYLLTKKDYADYRLRFEFSGDDFASHGGVVVRGVPGEQLKHATGQRLLDHPLVRLTCGLKFDDPNGMGHWLADDGRTPAGRFAAAATDQWHPVEVVVVGDACTVELDGRLLTEIKLDRAARVPPGFAAGLARKAGRVGFLVSGGTMQFRNVSVQEVARPDPAVAAKPPAPAPPPAPVVPPMAGDPFTEGSTWRGVKIIDTGTGAGTTSFYELRIESRTGNAFAGAVVDKGPATRELVVTGKVGGGKIEWKEADRDKRDHATTVTGAIADGMLTLDTAGSFGPAGTNKGRAKLCRDRGAGNVFDDFYPIFNGRNIETWWEPHPDHRDGWAVTPTGTLVGRGKGPAHLYTKLDFENVHVWCRVRVNDGGDAGVLARTPFGPGPGGVPEGYEAQVATSRAKEPAGSLLRVAEVKAVGSVPVKADEWFDLELIVQGNRQTVRVNGKETADVRDIKPLSKGRIALQARDAKTTVEFAMIAVRELKP
jgi:hypothetical protein